MLTQNFVYLPRHCSLLFHNLFLIRSYTRRPLDTIQGAGGRGRGLPGAREWWSAVRSPHI